MWIIELSWRGNNKLLECRLLRTGGYYFSFRLWPTCLGRGWSIILSIVCFHCNCAIGKGSLYTKFILFICCSGVVVIGHMGSRLWLTVEYCKNYFTATAGSGSAGLELFWASLRKFSWDSINDRGFLDIVSRSTCWSRSRCQASSHAVTFALSCSQTCMPLLSRCNAHVIMSCCLGLACGHCLAHYFTVTVALPCSLSHGYG